MKQLDAQHTTGFVPQLATNAMPFSVECFKTFPRMDLDGVWGVYVIAMEKANTIPKVYVGSGTDATRGLRIRMRHYDRKHCIPFNVKLAFCDGYAISQAGKLL